MNQGQKDMLKQNGFEFVLYDKVEEPHYRINDCVKWYIGNRYGWQSTVNNKRGFGFDGMMRFLNSYQERKNKQAAELRGNR